MGFGPGWLNQYAYAVEGPLPLTVTHDAQHLATAVAVSSSTRRQGPRISSQHRNPTWDPHYTGVFISPQATEPLIGQSSLAFSGSGLQRSFLVPLCAAAHGSPGVAGRRGTKGSSTLPCGRCMLYAAKISRTRSSSGKSQLSSLHGRPTERRQGDDGASGREGSQVSPRR